MDELLDEKQEMKNKRGKTLPVLCILSWIAIGLTFLSVSSEMMKGQLTQEELRQEQFELLSTADTDLGEFYMAFIEETVAMMEVTNEKFWTLMSINLCIVILGFFGVLLMFKLQKKGFYLYLAYCIIPMIVSLSFFGDFKITIYGLIFNVIFSGLFIILYGVQLKRME